MFVKQHIILLVEGSCLSYEWVKTILNYLYLQKQVSTIFSSFKFDFYFNFPSPLHNIIAPRKAFLRAKFQLCLIVKCELVAFEKLAPVQ